MKYILLFMLAGLGLAMLSHAAQAQDFSGTYAVTSPEGTMQLTLRQDAHGVVTGVLVAQGVAFQAEGSLVYDEEDEEHAVEGTLAGPQGGGEFAFYTDDDEEDGYYLFIVPYDANGMLRLDLSAEYAARRGEAAGPQGGTLAPPPVAQKPPTDAPRDPRLVGVWTRQVSMLSPQGSVVTELLREIRADGLLIDHGSRAVGSFPGAGLDTGAGTGGEALRWRTQDGHALLVSYTGTQWAPVARYEVSGESLLLMYLDGSQHLWSRRR